jgi:hypothetical protein
MNEAEPQEVSTELAPEAEASEVNIDELSTAEALEKSTPVDDTPKAEDIQAKHQREVNKQHRKYREEQRRADALQKQLDELQSKVKPASEVKIPPLPESWDENFEEKLRERDEAIQRKAAQDAIKQQQADAEALAQREAETRQREQSQKREAKFIENAEALSVDAKELDEAQSAVIEYGITPDIAVALLEDSHGPLMVKYLAANPLELGELISARPVEAGMRLAEIKAKASAPKQTTSAPVPPTALNGKTAKHDTAGPPGATFE